MPDWEKQEDRIKQKTDTVLKSPALNDVVIKRVDNLKELVEEKHKHHRACLEALDKIDDACILNNFDEVKRFMKEFKETVL